MQLAIIPLMQYLLLEVVSHPRGIAKEVGAQPFRVKTREDHSRRQDSCPSASRLNAQA